MKKYKSVILGCGPRAVSHIKAYEGIEDIYLHAACDKDTARLNEHGKIFKIPSLYTDFEEMLEKEHPDILHIVTPPSIREMPIEMAAKYGVKGIIVEKPIALNLAQAEKIKNIAERTGIKIAVNMQRRYFKCCQNLKKVLNEGQIGDIYFIRCVTKGNILSWGPHLIDLLLYFLNDISPTHIWATAYGMNGHEYGHPAPANMLINLHFPGQIAVYYEAAEDAVGVWNEPKFWMHGELDFWGTKGRAWWTQSKGWGYQSENMLKPHLEKTSWEEDDIPGQRKFTCAMAEWLDNDSNKHLNCLDNALIGFDLIMAAFQSAYIGRRVQLPINVGKDINERLEEKIK